MRPFVYMLLTLVSITIMLGYMFSIFVFLRQVEMFKG